jgi:hypothetical protein
MNFKIYVETPYREWVIQQTWNDRATQYDRVAVKGTQRVKQGPMTYQAFVQELDLLDGQKAIPSPWGKKGNESAPAPEPPPAIPCHQSLFEECL